MTLWLGLLIGGAAVAATVAYYGRDTDRLMERYGDAFRAYNSAAFTPIVDPSPHEHMEYVTRLAAELISKKGQRAIAVMPREPGNAIHHVNQDGTFSAKGPYFVSWRSGNWRRTGSTHLVKVLRGKGSWGFKPDHYKQTGLIREKGVAILEYATTRYAPVSIREFVARQGKNLGRSA
jgi:hypothetical protein